MGIDKATEVPKKETAYNAILDCIDEDWRGVRPEVPIKYSADWASYELRYELMVTRSASQVRKYHALFGYS